MTDVTVQVRTLPYPYSLDKSIERYDSRLLLEGQIVYATAGLKQLSGKLAASGRRSTCNLTPWSTNHRLVGTRRGNQDGWDEEEDPAAAMLGPSVLP